MFTSTTLLALSGLACLSNAGYTLQDDYSASNFFSMFDFFTADDPTHGYVNYVDQNTAQSDGLIKNTNGGIYMGVDSTNVATGRGRNSVRITSKNTYNSGLVILDLAHMPGSVCGTWPAFWMVGPNWPSNGEIDIIEGVNGQTSNAMTLHTGAGCSISSSNDFSGTLSTSNCDINAAGQAANTGCGITTSQTNSYGDGFNANQGGVYATEWTSSAINIYFFPRGSVPSDVSSGSPNPSNWGTPLASFGSPSSCQIDNFFKNQQIVFDTTFCGDWAGNVWSSGSCASKASTCQDFVQNNPSAFQESYWSINSLQVFSNNGAPSSSNSSAPTASSASQPAQSIPVSSAWPQPAASSWPAGQPQPGQSTPSVVIPVGQSSVPIPVAPSSAAPASQPPATSAQPAPPQSQTSWGWGHGGGGGGGHTWTQNQAGGQFFATTALSASSTDLPVASSSSPSSNTNTNADSPTITSGAAAENQAAPSNTAIPTTSNDDNPYAVVVGPNGILGETQEKREVTAVMTTFAVVQTKSPAVVADNNNSSEHEHGSKRDDHEVEALQGFKRRRRSHLMQHKRRETWKV